MKSVFVTGASRGMGLEWVRQYAEAGWRVYATCRSPEQAAALKALAARQPGISMHRLDVCDSEQVRTLQLELEDARIDVLINNAGVYLDKSTGEFGSIDYEAWQRTFAVNTMGAMRVSEAFVKQVARSEKRLMVAITSHMGSIAEITAAGNYAYRSSKAALNAAMKGLSLALARAWRRRAASASRLGENPHGGTGCAAHGRTERGRYAQPGEEFCARDEWPLLSLQRHGDSVVKRIR